MSQVSESRPDSVARQVGVSTCPTLELFMHKDSLHFPLSEKKLSILLPISLSGHCKTYICANAGVDCCGESFGAVCRSVDEDG